MESKESICAVCPLNVNGVCSKNKIGLVVKDFSYRGEERKEGDVVKGCNCPLHAKHANPNSQCPLGKF